MKTIFGQRRRIYRGKLLCLVWREKYPDYLVINLDKLTYAGNLDNLKECGKAPLTYKFVQGDI